MASRPEVGVNADGVKKMSVGDLKTQGNDYFNAGEFKKAIDTYTEAIQAVGDEDKVLRAVLYRNRAMVKFRIDDFEGAESDCTKTLELDGVDGKAYFRRAQAREQLEKFGQAYADAKEAYKLNKNDKKVKELVDHLAVVNTQKSNLVNSIGFKFSEMKKFAFEQKKDPDQVKKALSNLMVLAREGEGGASVVWDNGATMDIIIEYINNKENDDDCAFLAFRILDVIIKNRKRCMEFVEKYTIPVICKLFVTRAHCKQIIESVNLIVQRVFNALCAFDRSKQIKPDPEVAEANKMHIIKLILELEDFLCDRQYNYAIRESVIDLFVKNLMHMDGGIPRGWSWRFIEDRGLLKLLHIASQDPELSDYPVSAETRNHVAICLQRLHDDCVFDTKRAIYKEKVDGFFNHLLSTANTKEVQVKLASLLICLLQGPVDIGLSLITSDTVMAITLQMAKSEDKLLQSLAAELIVQSVSKHERAMAMLKIGLPVLKTLYDSPDHNVKVRALMGLCKCAAAGGDDVSKATMNESHILNLANRCKTFLLSVDKYSVEVRRFACEGLSYLTLDADIKELIVNDRDLLKALLALAQSAGALCVFTLASIYVNLTNAFDKPKVDEEMVKLAQFAKHHVPELHPKDTDEYVEQRIAKLVRDGAITACIAISKTESKNALDLISKAMMSFCDIPEIRGQIISAGGATLLIKLYKECNEEGRIKACHALAKLGITSDPNIAFSGQRMYEVVRPMVELLNQDLEGKANYEALLTLTNLASISDSVRRKIVNERAVPKIEDYWYIQNHDDLRAAAAECLLNLLFLDDFRKDVCTKGTDRLKLWVLYCNEGDERLQMASSAGFAILTQDEAACRRILDEIKSWPEVFQEMCMEEDPEIQRRCLVGIANMVVSSEYVASEIMATEIFRILVAITKLPQKDRAGSIEEAKRALDAAENTWKIVKGTDRQKYENLLEKNKVLSAIKE
uniref:TPR_REGION domain-containing protein n=1 Tax=Rhabditophanes sp. KR3021 TaxID=114890 RepID=A0AC35UAV9_9BILA